eukprot:1159208-Pelagomonas_calceolata.AAC.12
MGAHTPTHPHLQQWQPRFAAAGARCRCPAAHPQWAAAPAPTPSARPQSPALQHRLEDRHVMTMCGVNSHILP